MRALAVPASAEESITIDPFGRAGGERVEAGADALVKRHRLALEPVGGLRPRLGALEPDLDGAVEQERERGREPVPRPLVERADDLQVEPAAVALVGDRRVGEAIAHDDPTVGQGRADHLGHVLRRSAQ